MFNWKSLNETYTKLRMNEERKLWVKKSQHSAIAINGFRWSVYVHCVWANVCNAPFKWKANRFFIAIIISSVWLFFLLLHVFVTEFFLFLCFSLPHTITSFIIRCLNRFIESWRSQHNDTLFYSSSIPTIQFNFFFVCVSLFFLVASSFNIKHNNCRIVEPHRRVDKKKIYRTICVAFSIWFT